MSGFSEISHRGGAITDDDGISVNEIFGSGRRVPAGSCSQQFDQRMDPEDLFDDPEEEEEEE